MHDFDAFAPLAAIVFFFVIFVVVIKAIVMFLTAVFLLWKLWLALAIAALIWRYAGPYLMTALAARAIRRGNEKVSASLLGDFHTTRQAMRDVTSGRADL